MRFYRAGLMSLAIAVSQMAWAQADVITGALPKGGATQAPRSFRPDLRALNGGLNGSPSTKSLQRFSSALSRLGKDDAAHIRGGQDVTIYRAASPSVVLIVTEEGLGSGALLSADGLIITNAHVVGDFRTVGVIFKPAVEGQQVTRSDVVAATVVKKDEVADLALIKVAQVPPGHEPLMLGSISEVSVGSDVHAIGHPTGEAWTYTKGIVSQIRRGYSWQADDKLSHSATVIQTQTPINPGNSGGPLLDDALHVVGINAFKSEGEGLNFAISADDVRAFLARPGSRIEPKVKNVAASQCEPPTLKTWRETKPIPANYALTDADCDGKADSVLITPDDNSKANIWLLDTNGDGKIDIWSIDNDHDGLTDVSWYDTDGDEKPDLAGYWRKGDEEPFRYERISR